MEIIGIIVGLIIFAIVLFVIYRALKVKRQNNALNQARFERVRPLYAKLEKGEYIDPSFVLPFANDILSRNDAFQLLKGKGKEGLFPEELCTIERGAESVLANWLEFPTELNCRPDEMQYVKRVSIDFDDVNKVYYHVFQFKTYEPHWAAKNGWMLGVTGPYFDDSKPYDHSSSTFSRLSEANVVSADEEAKWVHENISKRG